MGTNSLVSEAIVLVGGKGTRLQSVVSDVPKPMAPVAGKPFLDYLLKFISQNGVSRVLLSAGYRRDVVRQKYDEGFPGLKDLVVVDEENPLGTGGAILHCLSQIQSERFFIFNGDTFFDVPLQEMSAFHLKNKADFTLALKSMSDFDRYGTVTTGEDLRVTGFFEKKKTSHGMINGGIYLTEKNFFLNCGRIAPFSTESDLLQTQYSTHKIFGFPSEGYFLDIGIPEDYFRAQKEMPEVCP